MSHQTVVHLIDKVGSNHDFEVKKWKSLLEENLTWNFAEGGSNFPVDFATKAPYESLYSSDSESSSGSSSDSDCSAPPFSLLVSSDEQVSFDSDSDIDEPGGLESLCKCTVDEPKQPATEEDDMGKPSFKLCGDNVDKTVRHRCMGAECTGTLSLHYFHLYGVLDRVTFDKLSPVLSPKPPIDPIAIMNMLLPTSNDVSELHENFMVLISQDPCDSLSDLGIYMQLWQ